MCCLFGLIDYADTFTAKEKNRLIKILSTECEARGTNATGIAFNTESGLHISKRPVSAHKMWYRIPNDVKVVMGHTRMTTQGSEKFNFNNHPFFGHVDKLDFALAHNGVLHNDNELRISERLPKTNIQTDSYVAVQLIEKENTLGFDAIRKMAEKTEGSFCYTILDQNDNLYFVKGDNPMAIYKFNGFYLYASTDEILAKAVKKIGLRNYSRINISCGDILKISPYGNIEVQTFCFKDRYFGAFGSCYGNIAYDPFDYESEDIYIDEITEYAGYFGIAPEDVVMLLEYGYDELEIEEMLYDPLELQKCISEIKLCEMLC